MLLFYELHVVSWLECPPGTFTRNLLCKGRIWSSRIRKILRGIRAFVISSLYCGRLNNPPTDTHTQHSLIPGTSEYQFTMQKRDFVDMIKLKILTQVIMLGLDGSDVITKVLVKGMQEESKDEMTSKRLEWCACCAWEGVWAVSTSWKRQCTRSSPGDSSPASTLTLAPKTHCGLPTSRTVRQ